MAVRSRLLTASEFSYTRQRVVQVVKFNQACLQAKRVQSVKFFIIDSEGKAGIEDLKTGIYYVCGVGKTSRKSEVWNVRVELKPGKNSLKLDGGNITGRRNLV